MDHQLSENVWKVLKCPNCGGSLDRISVGAVCNHCRTRYLCTDSGSLDLRLIGPKTCLYEFNLGSALLPESGFDFGVLSNNDAPEVDFGNFKGKHHLYLHRPEENCLPGNTPLTERVKQEPNRTGMTLLAHPPE